MTLSKVTILIIMLWGGGVGNAEFNTPEACEKAKAQIHVTYGYRVTAICVSKQ